MNNIRITAFKELRSIFRDKKTLVLLFTIPLMIPMLIFFYGYMFDNFDEDGGGENVVGIIYELNDEEKALLKELKIEIKKKQKKLMRKKLLMHML